jgi:hypothetical protein
MVNFKAKIVKIGNSYGFIVPKSYVDNGLVVEDIKYAVCAEVVSDDAE